MLYLLWYEFHFLVVILKVLYMYIKNGKPELIDGE